MKTTPSTSNLQSEGSSSSTSSDVPLLVREKIDETTSSTSNPQSTPKSRTSSSSSSSSSPLREECQDTINVWKRLDEVLKLKSAPDCSEWTNDDRRWKTVGNIFAAWVTLQQSKNAFKNVGKKLDLSGLELTHLPDCLGKLPFRELDLRSNKLKALPDWIYHPFWWGELLFNASTFDGNYSDKYAEFLVKCHTNFKIAHVHGPQKLQSITNCSLSPIVRIAQYMVVGRYVFPFIENKVWIPEDFNINLIKSELAEARTRIKIDRKKLDDEVCKKMKISHPLAEAFFTGNASGDQSISENDAKTRFVQSCPPGHITTRLSEDQFGNFF